MRRGGGFRGSFGGSSSFGRRAMSSHRFSSRPLIRTGYGHRGYYGGYGMGYGYGRGIGGGIFLFFILLMIFGGNLFFFLILLIVAAVIYNSRSKSKARSRPPQRYHTTPPRTQPTSSGTQTYKQRPKAKFCPACGAGLLQESQFCSECGTKV
ncbi:MAG: zinc ribbon domain-containing protein [Candidatus Kariarchaeaceae archaeon]